MSILSKKSINSQEFSDNKFSHLNKFIIDKNTKFNPIFFSFLLSQIKIAQANPVNTQNNIESQWKELILENIENFQSKSRQNIKNILNKANETLILKLEKKKYQKKYNLIYKVLSKRHLLLSYSLLTIYYDKLGYTSLAIKIGNDILFDIFSLEWKNMNLKNKPQYITFSEYLLVLGINNLYILNLGSFFIEIFSMKPTQLFDRVYKDKYKDEVENDLAVLEVNEDYFNFLQNNKIITPVSLPMLCPPNK